jgi:hypothetical protein
MMSHILAKINGVKIQEVERMLKADFLTNAAEGIFLEHLWQNTENQQQVFFLFRSLNLTRAKEFMNHMYKEARKEDPDVLLPEVTFLEGT